MNEIPLQLKTIETIQTEIREWVQKNSARFDWEKKHQPLIGMQEELGELAHAFLKKEQGIRTDENHFVQMVDAVGDILIYLFDFCNRMEIDAGLALRTTWVEVRRRNWEKYPRTGKSTDAAH